MTDGVEQNVRTHSRTLESATEFLDLGEHVSWELGQAVDPVDYPLEVEVTIEVSATEDTEVER